MQERLLENLDFLLEGVVLRFGGTEFTTDGIDETIAFSDIGFEGRDVF